MMRNLHQFQPADWRVGLHTKRFICYVLQYHYSGRQDVDQVVLYYQDYRSKR